MKTLQNNLISIRYTNEPGERADIFIQDLTDHMNEPCAYTRNVRGIAKAWNELIRQFSETMTMSQAISILNVYKLNTHYYCAVD